MRKKDVVMSTIIGRGAECSSDFSAEGSVRIDGCVNGNVTITGTLIVGVSGAIHGDVSAAGAVIGGEVTGSVTAPEKVELTATARVIGDIKTGTIVIDEKAIFQGKCDMNQDVTAKRPKPSGKALRAGKKSAKAAIAEALREVEAENREEAAAEANEKAVAETTAETVEVKKEEQ